MFSGASSCMLAIGTHCTDVFWFDLWLCLLQCSLVLGEVVDADRGRCCFLLTLTAGHISRWEVRSVRVSCPLVALPNLIFIDRSENSIKDAGVVSALAGVFTSGALASEIASCRLTRLEMCLEVCRNAILHTSVSTISRSREAPAFGQLDEEKVSVNLCLSSALRDSTSPTTLASMFTGTLDYPLRSDSFNCVTKMQSPIQKRVS